MKAISLSLVATLCLVAPIASNAATIEERVFSPHGCEYSVIFPTAPVVEDRVSRSTGNHALQAQTPGDAFPWILAQCTTGSDGSPPPDIKERLELVRDVLQGKGAKNIRSSSVRDARGHWAKATGEIIVSGRPLTMTVSNVAGASSMLFISGFMRDATDNSRFEQFLADVERHPSPAARR